MSPGVQHPMREVIALDNPAQATVHDSHSASLFIPGSWTGRRMLLKPPPGVDWSAVQTEMGKPVRLSGGAWELTAALEPGRWQRLSVQGGPLAGALLESSDPLCIARLEGWYDPPETISIRVRLAKSPAATGRQGEITLLFTLTDERGVQVGRQEVAVGPKTVELAVALVIARAPQGRCRLKAALCLDQQVVDDARVEVEEF